MAFRIMTINLKCLYVQSKSSLIIVLMKSEVAPADAINWNEY